MMASTHSTLSSPGAGVNGQMSLGTGDYGKDGALGAWSNPGLFTKSESGPGTR